ncbi:hypothetical protein ACDH60_11825 [Pseudomonas ficuserectae]|uniref:Uncharacterized protein n=2 Tax=Pseudomonas amygdali pv. lachrymans TaxID=53707 RepID=A0AB37RE10_PSEAV|nr:MULTISPECIES: hypothetical protein [Pseudomonas syringae group]AKF46284.1 hypothetical protein PsyrB_14005 [Pseudomonas syringae pv. syringae B301D]ARA80847.1 hypothetical protein B5U27_12685 [Pseudomonas amygdali pv. lachrymans]AXH56340.1 hypothetical protein PLA107_014240 [Pseudomonas amygdali pv. lachrymans str. M301315]EXL31201.1 hypothetical protein PssB301D_02494 [Pseudomonas syringae pv. syringae str. B301D-R]KKY59709.1 hypothetical protein AAY85_01650 [Pseudomonas amygdali pv. lachr
MPRKKAFISIPDHQADDFRAAQKSGLQLKYGKEHPGLLTAPDSFSFESKTGSVYKGIHRFFFAKHTTEIDFSYDCETQRWWVTRDFND